MRVKSNIVATLIMPALIKKLTPDFILLPILFVSVFFCLYGNAFACAQHGAVGSEVANMLIKDYRTKTPVDPESYPVGPGSSYVTDSPDLTDVTSHKKDPETSAQTNLLSRMDYEHARAVRNIFIGELSKDFGVLIGYKAGITNPAMQRRLGVKEPVLGMLLKSMLLKNGSELSARFGAVPMAEGDLLLRVGSEEINKAKTIEEAVKHIDAVIPFLELPDLTFVKGARLTGPMISAVNVGARYGVMGEVVPVDGTNNGQEWIKRLQDMSVEIIIRETHEKELRRHSNGLGSAVMGNPLNAVLWIRDAVAAEGGRLKKGDLLSVGNITALLPVKPGETVRASYSGLTPKGSVTVSVSFTE